MTIRTQQELIVDQFTRQAVPFSTAKTITNDAALRLILDESGAGPEDTVLDVGCGGGVVACFFAQTVRHATGIDVTPAMLDQARALAMEKKLTNVTWQQADVQSRLPHSDGAFSLVVSRFTFHHFLDPVSVLRDMARVCAPGGRIQVIDMVASENPVKAAEFNRMEKLRDPSHVRAFPADELMGLFAAARLRPPRRATYELRDELTNLLGRSFPNPGDDVKIREIFARAAEDDCLGLPVRREGEHLYYAYPVTVLTAQR
ncbi:MAG TPA: class I SAM-dependent methyltransferase [Burkholderiales bacterium]|nr:class I SAM-dependent methyltransferase [Burkholderiales bacterium]